MSLKSLISVTCVAMVLAMVLIGISAAVVLTVSLTSSLKAAEGFAETYSLAGAMSGSAKLGNALSVPTQRYEAVAYGTATASLDDYIATTSFTTRATSMDGYLSSFRNTLFETAFGLIGVAAVMRDRSMISCAATRPATEEYTCTVLDRNNATTGGGWETITSVQNTTIVGKYSQGSAYDGTQEAWYNNTPNVYNAPGRYSVPFVHPSLGIMVVNATGPLFNSTYGFMGVVVSTLDLSDLSQFLYEARSTANTLSVVIDDTGYVVGVSNRVPLFTELDISTRNLTTNPLPSSCTPVNNRSVARCLIHANDFSSNAALSRLFSDHQGVLSGATTNPSPQRLTLGKSSFYVTAALVYVASTTNMAWKMLSLVPEDDVIGDIIAARNLAIILACVVILVSCILCALALWALLRPLAALAVRMEETATLRDDLLTEEGDRSLLGEIRNIQDAFYKLCGQLKKAKSFLPATLIAQLEGDDEDFDDEDEGLAVLNGSSVSADRSASGSRIGAKLHDNRSQASSRKYSVQDTATTHSSKSRSSRVPVKVSAVADLSVTQRTVSVLTVNARGFHRAVAKDPTLLAAKYGELLDHVRSVSGERRGILDSFNGDRFVVTFNAVRHAGSHATMATLTALELTRNGYHNLALVAGVATGAASVGNMGSETQRRFCTIGHVYTQATLLERMVRRYRECKVLLAGPSAQDAETNCDLLYVDLVPLPSAKRVPLRLASAKGVKERKGDEWMYELNAAESGSAYGIANCAFAECLEGCFEEAARLLSGFTAEGADAAHVRQLIGGWIARGVVRPSLLEDYYDTCITHSIARRPTMQF